MWAGEDPPVAARRSQTRRHVAQRFDFGAETPRRGKRGLRRPSVAASLALAKSRAPPECPSVRCERMGARRAVCAHGGVLLSLQKGKRHVLRGMGAP